MKPEDYSRRQQELAGWPITIETYKLGDVYHCTIANVDPGARVARADGASREEAEQRARRGDGAAAPAIDASEAVRGDGGDRRRHHGRPDGASKCDARRVERSRHSRRPVL